MLKSLTKTFTVAATIACALIASAHAAITISTHTTTDENCSAGICTPTGPNPNIRVKDLQKLLVHSDMKIVTGQGSTDIDVVDPLTWASKHRLTLDANQSIHVRAPIVVEGKGGVTLITNDGGTGGNYYFDAPGSLTFWDLTSSLLINGQSFTLVKDIATLASGIAATPSGNYALAKSYDASVDGTYANAPIATQFFGTFEGLANTISKLTIATADPDTEVGLFRLSSGVLRDINLQDVNITGAGEVQHTAGSSIGALVGYNTGMVFAGNASGAISGGKNTTIGGLVGANDGTISNSTSTAKVTAGARAYAAGGLAGWVSGVVQYSRASGSVKGGGDLTGGLVGYNFGRISQSFATGQVMGPLAAGGLVGVDGAVGPNSGIIDQCYATGAVSPRSDHTDLGGLVGQAGPGSVSQSYATGKVPTGRDNAGFAGSVYDGFQVDSSYWDVTTTGQDQGTSNGNFSGLTGLTDAQLKSALPAGFDPNVWGRGASINNGGPYLLANPPQ